MIKWRNIPQRQALMLLPSSLPPQFLLPAWTAKQLLRRLQRRRSYSHGREDDIWEKERHRSERDREITARYGKERVYQLEKESKAGQEANAPKGNEPIVIRRYEARGGVRGLFGLRLNDIRKHLKDFRKRDSEKAEPAEDDIWEKERHGSEKDREMTARYGKEAVYQLEKESKAGHEANAVKSKGNEPIVRYQECGRGQGSRYISKHLKDLRKSNSERAEPAANTSPNPDTYNERQDSRTSSKSPIRAKHGIRDITERKEEQNSQTHPSSKPEKELSLFEELFPEETQTKPSPKKPQNSPWFPPPSALLKDTGFPPLEDVRAAAALTSNPPSQRHHDPSKILILSGAPKNLEESDFLRINPKGVHIDGWASGMMKIIPGRNPQTLVPNGSYILIFPTPITATIYKDTLLTAHRQIQTLTPQFHSSPLPTSLSFTQKSPLTPSLTHIDPVSDYTILPPSQKTVSINRPFLPLRPALQNIVDNGGYKQIVTAEEIGGKGTGGTKAGLVKVSVVPGVEGSRSVHGMRDFLERDGTVRRLGWKLSFGGEGAIMRVEGEMGNGTEVGGRGGSGGSRWIVAFRDVAEARRFVRVWHRRRWTDARKEEREKEREREGLWFDVYEEGPVVSAELLW